MMTGVCEAPRRREAKQNKSADINFLPTLALASLYGHAKI